MKQLAIFLLGSNLGNRLDSLEKAMQFLHSEIGQHETASSIYESAPWGKTDQPGFLNQVIGIRTSIDPFSILKKCLSHEKSAGRIREEQWGPRIIDIDLLYLDDRIIHESNLRVPHPGIPARRFTLIPLCEIYPAMVHPESGKTHLQLLQSCTDRGEVNLFELHA